MRVKRPKRVVYLQVFRRRSTSIPRRVTFRSGFQRFKRFFRNVEKVYGSRVGALNQDQVRVARSVTTGRYRQVHFRLFNSFNSGKNVYVVLFSDHRTPTFTQGRFREGTSHTHGRIRHVRPLGVSVIKSRVRSVFLHGIHHQANTRNEQSVGASPSMCSACGSRGSETVESGKTYGASNPVG